MTCTVARRLARLLLLVVLALGTQAVGARPRLSFFCELDGASFLALMQDSVLLADLRQMGAEVRVGILDLSEERAEGVKLLNAAGVPAVAWLLLPESEGYWFNAFNGARAAERYQETTAWSATHGLIWKGFGLDLEPQVEEVRMAQEAPWKAFWAGWQRLYQPELISNGQAAYRELVRAIRADGFSVESYILPPILDERKANSSTLQQFLGILDIRTDREIPMCYTSAGLMGPAVILSYGEETRTVALGSSGGGIRLGDGKELPSLSWEELERDLLLAQQVAGEVHIFSLEGCVRQGWIPRLKQFNYRQAVELYSKEIQDAENGRKRLRQALRALKYPTWLVLGAAFASLLVLLLLFLLLRAGLRAVFRLFRRST